MANDKDEKKGFGPALAAMILAIIAFVSTAVTAVVLNICLNLPEFWDAFTQTFNEIMGTAEISTELVKSSIKITFALFYYNGGLFLFISLICFIVALVKYFNNTTQNKAKSVLILACIAGTLILVSLIIATVGFVNASKMIDAMLNI